MTEPTVTDMIVTLIPPVIILLIILTALAINKYLAKKRNVQRTKRKLWDKYNKTDINVPMAYFHFYITVRPIFSAMRLLATIFEAGISNIDISVLSIQILELLTYFCACIGMAQRKYWGYKINKIFLIVGNIGYAVLFVMNILIQNYESVPSFFAGIIVNVLSLIYFQKRENLFEGAPIKSCNKSDDNEEATDTAKEDTDAEILFRRNCSNCGTSFKIRWHIPQNNPTASKISAACPNCKKKITIDISEFLPNTDVPPSNDITHTETKKQTKTAATEKKRTSYTIPRPRYKMKWKNRMLNITMIPLSVELNKDTLLPQTVNRQYGFGKRFNTFVVTDNQNFYHRSSCSFARDKKKYLLHRYIAIQNIPPCPYCNPNDKIDEWYINFVKTNFGADINYNEVIKNNELTQSAFALESKEEN